MQKCPKCEKVFSFGDHNLCDECGSKLDQIDFTEQYGEEEVEEFTEDEGWEDEVEEELEEKEEVAEEQTSNIEQDLQNEETEKINRVVNYVVAICKACRNRGLKIVGFNGEEKDYSAGYFLQFEVEEKRKGVKYLLNELKDKRKGHRGHWTYIDSLGLINRGFCPYCGELPIDDQYTFTVYGYTIYLCKFCYEKGSHSQKKLPWRALKPNYPIKTKFGEGNYNVVISSIKEGSLRNSEDKTKTNKLAFKFENDSSYIFLYMPVDESSLSIIGKIAYLGGLAQNEGFSIEALVGLRVKINVKNIDGDFKVSKIVKAD